MGWEAMRVRDRGDFAIGLLVGGLVGALVGILLAPAAGDEVRATLGRQTTDAANRLREGAGQLAGRVRDGAGETSERAMGAAQRIGERVRGQVRSALGTVQQAVDEAVGELAPVEPAGPLLGEAAATVEGRGGEIGRLDGERLQGGEA